MPLLREVFEAALERTPEARAAFVEGACAGDARLMEEVQRLLSAHARAGAFLEGSALDSDEDEATPAPMPSGLALGAYRLVREIGRGGMGAVYLAERADAAFEKQVAVKVIKRGMDTDAVLRHFRNERQILASLEHPNIARLLDGGTTEGGLPYFVMEYVEGRPIDAFCAERALPLSQRLDLFRQVCAAVSYAHQRLVVHRDLKPSNVLVTADGVPKLLDFGIARILSPDPGGPEAETATLRYRMTPEYASPEQLRGQPATTLTDVYSLGVVLHEILTGRRPPRTGAAPPPSTIDRRLRGDLDTIVLTALHEEPSRRYPSVEQLSADLLRHLQGRPVTARRDTFTYRASRFVARNTLATVSAALLLLTLIGGVVATSIESRRARRQEELARAAQARAERRFQDVRAMVRAQIFDYHDAIKDLPGSTALRARLVDDALRFLDDLARESAGDRGLQLELAAAYERLADVKGGTMSANLGDSTAALAIHRKALDIRLAVMAADPENAQGVRDTALSYRKLGNMMLERGDLLGGLDSNRRSLALFEGLAARDPGNADLRYEVGRAHDYVGLFLLEQGDAAGALQSYRRYLSALQGLPPAEQRGERIRRAFTVAHERTGMALLQLAQLDEALEQNRQALALRAALCGDFPLNADYRRNLAVSHYNEGEILARMGRSREARDAYLRYAALAEALLRADPRNEVFRQDLGQALTRAGGQEAVLGDTAAALVHLRRARTQWAADVAADPGHLWKRASLIETEAHIGQALARAGQDAAARAACRSAAALRDGTHVEASNASIRGFFADTDALLGQTYAALAARAASSERDALWRAARERFAQARATWEDLRAQGRVSAADAAKPEAVAREAARADAAATQSR